MSNLIAMHSMIVRGLMLGPVSAAHSRNRSGGGGLGIRSSGRVAPISSTTARTRFAQRSSTRLTIMAAVILIGGVTPRASTFVGKIVGWITGHFATVHVLCDDRRNSER